MICRRWTRLGDSNDFVTNGLEIGAWPPTEKRTASHRLSIPPWKQETKSDTAKPCEVRYVCKPTRDLSVGGPWWA